MIVFIMHQALSSYDCCALARQSGGASRLPRLFLSFVAMTKENKK
jgi:hypothetical protein